MTYLIAKFSLLFLAATVLGFLLGYWWTRSRYVDITESYRKLTSRSDAERVSWDNLWKRMETLNLAPLHERVLQVETLVRSLPESTQSAKVDLQPLEKQLGGIVRFLKAMPQRESVDLSPLHDRLKLLESTIRSIPAPQSQESVDLSPLHNRLQLLSSQIRSIPAAQSRGSVDLGPLLARLQEIQSQLDRSTTKDELGVIQKRFEGLEQAIQKLPQPEKAERVNLTPLHDRIAGVERALRSFQVSDPVNLGPVESRLQAIEVKLEQLASNGKKPKKPSTPPRLFESASMGEKDDLKRISGIGPKLEKLLNRLGVYYFWQIASWNDAEVQAVDDMLDVFKGRIERDEWVSQAKILKQSPKAAREIVEYVSSNGV